MPENPFFSIIIPTFNRAHLILKTINCVLAQTFADFELILIDDASTDDTASVVHEINDSRIRYIKNDINLERSASRNKGIDLAQGEFICFCDSDDHWKLEHLAIIRKAIEENKFQDAFYFTGMTWCFPDSKQEVIFPKPTGNLVEYVIKHQIGTPTTCFSKTILNDHEFNTDLKINEDVELFTRIAASFNLIQIPESTVDVQIHKENTKALTKDYISPQIMAIELIFQNPELRNKISSKFKKEKRRNLDHQLIRYLAATQQRKQLYLKSLRFIFRYPNDPTIKEKIVFLVYNLPGGRLIQAIIQKIKKTTHG
jgi:glycosyltransferase involved in cell wall biosynthesis